MTYEGYAAQIDFDDVADVFCGTVVNANILISFRGSTVAELKKSLRNVVDTYLAEC